VLVLTPDHATTAALASALDAGRAADDPRTFVVVSAPQTAGLPTATAGLVTAARDWISALLAPQTLRLVGVGAAAEVALQSVVNEPGEWDAVLRLVGKDGAKAWSARILAAID
jgi:hypothetical protein